MEIQTEDLRGLASAPDADVVVVIDVLRAFSTAAVALDRGAVEIYPVLEVAEAFERRTRDPALVLMGESDCHPIKGFDLGNSPVAAAEFPFEGRRVVQRTTAGTRGLVTCASAPNLFAGSFLVAQATVLAIRALAPQRVVFVVTGTVHYGSAEEDFACAEWMAELLRGHQADVAPFLDRVRTSVAAATFLDPNGPLYAPGDVSFCAVADRVNFAMQARNAPQGLVLRAVPGA